MRRGLVQAWEHGEEEDSGYGEEAILKGEWKLQATPDNLDSCKKGMIRRYHQLIRSLYVMAWPLMNKLRRAVENKRASYRSSLINPGWLSQFRGFEGGDLH